MPILDFLAALPAEEKETFLELLDETGSTDIAMKAMMLVLEETEPKLAGQLKEPIGKHAQKHQESGSANRWAKRVQSFLGLDCYSIKT